MAFNLDLLQVKKIQSLKNDESTSCYIFGDGPSIKYFKLEKFSTLPSIISGQLFLHKDFHKLKLQSITNIEPWYFCPKIFQKKYVQDLRKIMKVQRDFIFENPKVTFFLNLTNFFSVRSKNVIFLHRFLSSNDMFLKKIYEQMDPFGGSFSTQIILAYILGYKKVYLIGFDSWVLEQSSSNRWYEIGEGECLPNVTYAEDFINIMSSVMDITIISVKENHHPILKSITYKSYTGEEPVYRENHELLSRRYLDLLNTFPSYKIYND
tara:strand:+ start:274 stop:1068 length:795 start_codon:yes stop_codon:yes gene_type:complete